MVNMEVFKPFSACSYFNKFEKSNNFSRFVCPYNFEVFSESDILAFSKNDNNVYNFKDAKDGFEKFKNWMNSSILISSKDEAFYIYELSYKIAGVNYITVGVVGALKLPKKGENYVIECEESLEEEVDKNFNFLNNSRFFSSPVSFVYERDRDVKFLNLIKNKTSVAYIFKAKQNGVVHKIWKIFEPDDVDLIKNFFKDKTYFIVSGAEKYAAALKYRDFLNLDDEELSFHPANYIMAYFFPKDSFSSTYLPVHRIVEDIDMFDGEKMLKKASKYFEVIFCKTLDSMRHTMFNFKRQGRNAFGVYVDDGFSVLVLNNESFFNDSLCSKLDVNVVYKIFFEDVLKLDFNKIRYRYIDIEAVEEVNSGKACFAVFLNAPRMGEIFNIVDNNIKLPSKSFSFFPKPVEGLLFYLYKDYNS